jgi:WD40 repeat protein
VRVVEICAIVKKNVVIKIIFKLMKETNMPVQTLLRRLLQAATLLLFCNFTHAGEPPTEPVLRIDPGEHTAMINRIASDPAGRYLVTASSDKTAKVWDLRDGRLLNTLRIPVGLGGEGQLYAVALSPDGQTVALGGWTGLDYDGSASIFLLDRASGRLLRRMTGLPNVIIHLTFSADGRTLAASLVAGGIRLFSVTDGRLLAQDTDYGDGSYSVQFSADGGKVLSTSWDGYLRLYGWNGITLNLLSKQATAGGKQPYAARFSPDGKQIAVGFNDTPAVNILNAADLSFAFAPDTQGVDAGLINVAWSADGKMLLAAGYAQAQFDGNWRQYLRRWPQAGRGAASDEPLTSGTIMDLLALSGGRLLFGGGGPNWGTVSAQGQLKLLHTPMSADLRAMGERFTLSDNGTQVRFGYKLYGGSDTVFESSRRVFVADQGLKPRILSAVGLNVTDWENTTAPKLNGAPLTLQVNETSRSLALLPDGSGFALGTAWNIRLFNRDGSQRWQQNAPGEAWSVNVSADGRWVVAAHDDGTIRWYRASDGTEQLAFFPHADKQRWVLWTPSGYYDASPGAENLIGWHVNNGKNKAADFFPASRFRDRFNRPDVLTKILDTQDEARAVQLANAESGRKQTTLISVAQVLPPVVEIVSPTADTAVNSTTVKVRYNVRTLADAPVTGLRVRVNGQAVSADRALKLKSDSGDTREVEVTIPEQDSEIALFAENKNGVSVPASLWVRWAGKKNTEETLFKPKLYVLAVGVSQYKNPDYNLGLAAKDASDFAAVFQKQKGKLYSDVVVKLLTDASASKDEVLDGLEWLKQQVTARDVGVMFLAGHGMNDNQGKYFFLPYNADPDKLLRTGVAQTDIKDTLNSLAGKAMFFVDSCHAGNALGTSKTRAIGGTTDALVNELSSAENGVIVFSSSTGKQLSQENPAWGNGAFTKAVVEGLEGKADLLKKGKITHAGLNVYVTERVKELTHGQQSPVSISPSGVTDFPIAVSGR